MRSFVVIGSLAASLGLANPAKSVEPVLQPVNPPEASFSERLDSAALISGGVIMGLHVGGDTRDWQALPVDQRPSLRAIVPKDWAGQVMCARLSSNDGTYEAQIDYRVPEEWETEEWETDVPDLAFAPHTDYPGDTAKIEPDNAAAVVSLGQCRSEPTRYAPAFWNAGPQDPAAGLWLLLNSYRASEVYLRVGEGAGARLVESCEAIADAPRMTFDFRCRLGPGLVAPGEVTRIEVNRIRRRRADPPLEFYIDLSR